jgi:hypothetical protein
MLALLPTSCRGTGVMAGVVLPTGDVDAVAADRPTAAVPMPRLPPVPRS